MDSVKSRNDTSDTLISSEEDKSETLSRNGEKRKSHVTEKQDKGGIARKGKEYSMGVKEYELQDHKRGLEA